ncbi:MAG: hypothetical protein RL186_399 [Pseudomonadota bacterium]
MLYPILALIVWTFVLWAWLLVTRLPALRQAKIRPDDTLKPGALDGLPLNVRQVAANYSHLHEQPTLFYALALVAHVGNWVDGVSIALAWGYVGTRVLHSLVQAAIHRVIWRFAVFALASLILMALLGVTLVRALGS